MHFHRAIEFNPDLKRLRSDEGLQRAEAFFKAADQAIAGAPGAMDAERVVRDVTAALQD
jgi:hypothetical protein